jgi:glucokinase
VVKSYTYYVLTGDIGGTNTSFAVFGVKKNKKFDMIFKKSYGSESISTFHDHVNEILARAHKEHSIEISHACFGAAGPVTVDRSFCNMNNLSWKIDVKELFKKTMLQKILLINDIESIGHGISYCDKNDHSRFTQIVKSSGNICEPDPEAIGCIVTPGTGLGAGILVYSKEKKMHIPIPSEGGHADFVPSNDLEWKLAKYLKTKVTTHHFFPDNERVLSGKGITNVYNFLKTQEIKRSKEVIDMIDALSDAQKPAAIFYHRKNCTLCNECIDIFIRTLARTAKNLAMTTLAFGGVYIAGGIPPKMIDELQKLSFSEMFEHNDQQSHLLKKMPVYVVMDYDINLWGACSAAVNFIDFAYRLG